VDLEARSQLWAVENGDAQGLVEK